jgi:hypothetical protein
VADAVSMLVEYVQAIKEEPDSVVAQIRISLDAFNVVLSFFTLNPQTATLAYTLATLAKQLCTAGGTAGTHLPYVFSSLKWLAKRQGRLDQELAKKLTS